MHKRADVDKKGSQSKYVMIQRVQEEYESTCIRSQCRLNVVAAACVGLGSLGGVPVPQYNITTLATYR